MTYESDAVIARAAGLSNEERYALDAIADGDPRLCKAALYDHARAIVDALSDDDLRAQIADLNDEPKQLNRDIGALQTKLNEARAERFEKEGN